MLILENYLYFKWFNHMIVRYMQVYYYLIFIMKKFRVRQMTMSYHLIIIIASLLTSILTNIITTLLRTI